MMDKYLTASQPDSLNDKIRKLQMSAFKTNSQEDTKKLLLLLLHSWSDGELVSRSLIEKEIKNG